VLRVLDEEPTRPRSLNASGSGNLFAVPLGTPGTAEARVWDLARRKEIHVVHKDALLVRGRPLLPTAPSAHFFLAMARHPLGQPDAAREALRAGVRLQEEAARGKQPPPWTARLSHALLRREAEGLLKTPSR
jgi:hypothetical protein